MVPHTSPSVVDVKKLLMTLVIVCSSMAQEQGVGRGGDTIKLREDGALHELRPQGQSERLQVAVHQHFQSFYRFKKHGFL